MQPRTLLTRHLRTRIITTLDFKSNNKSRWLKPTQIVTRIN